MKLFFRIIFIITLTLPLTFCSGSGGKFGFFSKRCHNSYDADYKGRYKIGDPYKINNITYYPKHQPDYEEIGLASWYGDDFHCKKTANGEAFNKKQLSAAHKTLPLPSVARVTNLENGRTVTVVINDRGPFVGNRIIDLSERAAEHIGMKNSGVANVKVVYLEEESNMLLAKLNLDKHIKYASNRNPSKKNVTLASASSNKNERSYVKKENLMDSPYKKIATAKSINNGEISILVGKYEDKSQALKTVKNLSGIGYTKLSQVFKQGKPLYEVQFASAIRNDRQANQLLKKIIDLGHPDAKVVSKN